ncbi:trafficking protein particle complex subunit 14 [Sphaeramia orbicularis]|uniref:trafficking protein particle complex subunit 14 n=1 Tax=Sphaeramia orbicularis TaxID=375764 RepID=UPI00117EBFB6|nr:microtubule-associated protein 11-like [Sphaeramia orbicularis]
MDSQCECFIYFPAAPISNLSDYKSVPRRNHVYLGETVQFLLVLRSRNRVGKEGGLGLRWKDLGGSLSAKASACAAETRQTSPEEDRSDVRSSCSEDGTEEEDETGKTETAEAGGRQQDTSGTFRQCSPLFIYCSSANERSQYGAEPQKSVLVLDDQIIFCLTVSLDKLPVNTLKVKIIVTVWKQEDEQMEVREHGYLTLLQLRNPAHTFQKDASTFKTQVSTTLNVLPPPTVRCQHMLVFGKHLMLLKVLNSSSQEEVFVRDVKILPNYNSSYLPMMPDGSVLIVDNVCHQSAEVTVASFCRVDSKSSRLPSMLSSLEEHNFLFQLQLQDKAEEDSSEGLEVPLVAVLQWYTPTFHFTRHISTYYSLPSISLDRPRLVMTASSPSTVRPLESFWVKFTLLNNLRDLLAVRLIWTAEGSAHKGGGQDSGLGAVICQSPLNNLGHCRKGTTLSFTVSFQILKTGLFELSQHMKLKLQFRASVSAPAVNSPSSPGSAVREPIQRHSLAYSSSFSDQQPSRSHHIRSGSVIEHPSTTPSVGEPVGRGLCQLSDHTFISLGKIAKRQCKVLVLEPVKDTHSK